MSEGESGRAQCEAGGGAARLVHVKRAEAVEQRAALGAVQAHLPHQFGEDRVVVVQLLLPVVLVCAQHLLEAVREHDRL